MRRLFRYATPVAWMSCLAALASWLVRMGEGRLSGPPLGQPGEWAPWATGTGPIDATFALLRLACLGVVVYLAGALLLEVAAQVSGARLLRRGSDALSIALVRRIVSGSIGMSVTAGALAAGTTSVAAAPLHPLTMEPRAAPASPGPATVSMRATPAGAPSAAVSMRATPADAPSATVSMRATPAEARSPAMSMRVTPDTARVTMRALTPTSAPMAPSTTSSTTTETETPVSSHAVHGALEVRVLAPGDHLWAVAEEKVADLLQRPGTDDEISTYWLRLVQLNRAELADPDNPDLVFPGQAIRLPPG